MNIYKLVQKRILGACLGKSLSEALIFASTDPQYDGRLFIVYENCKLQSIWRTCCVYKLVFFVLFSFSEQFWHTTCSADVASFWKRFGCTCQYVIRTNLTNLVLKKHISWLASPLFRHESTFTYVIDLYYVIYVHKSKYYLDNISLFHANWCMYLMQTANNDIIVSKNLSGTWHFYPQVVSSMTSSVDEYWIGKITTKIYDINLMYNGVKYFILPYMNLIGFQDFADPFQINLPYVLHHNPLLIINP